jgi:hypothetical protein
VHAIALKIAEYSERVKMISLALTTGKNMSPTANNNNYLNPGNLDANPPSGSTMAINPPRHYSSTNTQTASSSVTATSTPIQSKEMNRPTESNAEGGKNPTRTAKSDRSERLMVESDGDGNGEGSGGGSDDIASRKLHPSSLDTSVFHQGRMYVACFFITLSTFSSSFFLSFSFLLCVRDLVSLV